MAGELNFIKQTFASEKAARALYKNWRTNFIIPMLLGVLVFGAGILIPAITSSTSNVMDVLFISVYGIVAVVTFIPFSYNFRVWVFLFAMYAVAVGELIRYDILGDSGAFFVGMIVIATMMLSPKAGIIAIGVNIATSLLFGYLMLNKIIEPISAIGSTPVTIMDWISGTLTNVMLGVIVVLGFQRLEREFFSAQQQVENSLKDLQEERASLEQKVQERTVKLRRVNEIGRAITSILDPDEMLVRAVNMIGDEFECYFTAIYLMDVTEQWAELKEATGDAGKVLRENKFRVDVKGKSLVGAAIRTRQVRIALDVGSNPTRFDNPLLPYTRSQIAMPLMVGERIIGALEMHSVKESAFLQQEAETYQNMANEIAIALENARLFREAQQSLAEMRATQRQYLQTAWASLSSEESLEYALGEKEINQKETIFPLTLRDQIIGQIQLATRENLNPDQRNLIEAIATQASLALENARLVEESQSIAARERLANEIISKVWASTTMESILQTTIRELGRALEAAEAEIQVSMGQEENE